MAHSNQQEVPAYPRPSEAYEAPQPCYPPEKQPPPVGYPTVDFVGTDNPHAPPVHTQSKGDDFWKGCLAAICCCCCLDICCF